ncbi:hypothetical protein KQ941_28360 [Paenibacillus xylanexedens]|uniref:hypothetical protein n=1 Tax=Paenibacillus xylanexedens TaxID=528191 RepID=UPI001F39CDD8|nr:hypothetical protein [Paenibacillus xylanexedens]MCF7758357.1 hypothetical protein [Paenibacillus xylanexedens]
MKKLKSLFIATTLFTFSLSGSVFASEESSKDSINVPSHTVYNLDEKGEKLSNLSTFVSSDIDIYSIENDVTNSISLSGNVQTANGEKDFQITGELKKAGYTDSLIVGDLTDSTNNFEVVYFGIDKKPNSNLALLQDTFANDDNVVKLYLFEKDTRTFTFLETDQLDNKLNTVEIFNNSNSLNEAEHEDMFWYTKILEPVQEKVQDGITTFALASGKSDKTYTAVYNAGIAKITEKMTVRGYVEGPTALSGSSGDFTTKLYPLSVSTTSDVGSVNSKTSGWKIGVYQDTTLEIYTAPGDVIRSVMWDSSYSSLANLKLNVAWGLTAPNTGLTFGVGYTNSQNVGAKTLKTYDNSGTNKVRRTKVTVPKSQTLAQPDHSLDSIIKVGHYTTPGQKTLNLKFTYYIANSKDPYNSATGAQSHNLSFSYTSK